MSILEQAISDLQSIMENSNEFGTPCIFENDTQTVTVNCLTNKVMVEVVDNSNNIVVSERTTVAVHEQTLVNAGFTVRDANNDVAMTNTRVTMTVFGEQKNYIVKYQIPDQKFGCLVFVLEYFSLL